MSRLLPTANEIEKISGEWKTFSDCSYNDDYEKLSFERKLQILNDIIRQSILIKDNPDPFTEMEYLVGDSYTASKTAIEYLKQFNLGQNHRMVLARKHGYENDSKLSKHVMVLLEDDKNNTYQFDCSAELGYGHGKVKKIDDERYYDEYIEIDDSITEILNQLRYFIYKAYYNIISIAEYKEIKELLSEAKKYSCLDGYTLYLESLIFGVKETALLESNNELVLRQISKWTEELVDLQKSKQCYQRQLELSQWIMGERIKLDSKYERYVNIAGDIVNLRSLNPRYFMEKELTLVLIKPSAYKLGIRGTIREKFLNRGNGAYGEYFPNMGAESENAKLNRMLFFHPHGYKYERSMTGPSDMFLIRKTPEETATIKKMIRTSYGKYAYNHSSQWFDGEEIYWEPIVTNLVHSTDNASETALHYLSPQPEYQIMTRYMYPNPVLKKERK